MNGGEIMAKNQQSIGGAIRRPSVSEYEKEALEARLAELNEALTALEDNPELQHLLDLVSKV